MGDKTFGGYYSKSLKEVRKIVQLSKLELDSYQREKLTEILINASQSSPYFKELINSEFSNPFEELKKLPILTKDIIRKNTSQILTQNKAGLIKNSTSGSTGVQTEIFINKLEQSLIRAIQTHWWEWAGFKIGYPMLQTGLATSRSIEKKLKDYFFRTKYQFAFGLNETNTKSSFLWAKNKRPFLGGYASSLYVLSQLAEEKNLKMKSAISWGDKLFDHYKRKIEAVFNCKIYETYGTGEGLMIASQMDLEYMYIMDPFVIIEIVDEFGNEVEDGQIGSILVTSLIHKAMPLIRYKPGDLAIKLPLNQYPKGRKLALSLLQKVIGRETDIVYSPNGTQLIVHSFTGVFEYFPEIKQFQVVQQRKSELLIRYIPDSGFRQDVLLIIEEKLNKMANEKLNLSFVQVEEILPSKSGKPQIIINEITPA